MSLRRFSSMASCKQNFAIVLTLVCTTGSCGSGPTVEFPPVLSPNDGATDQNSPGFLSVWYREPSGPTVVIYLNRATSLILGGTKARQTSDTGWGFWTGSFAAFNSHGPEWRFWPSRYGIPGIQFANFDIRIDDIPQGPPVPVLIDSRTEAQKADAPKIELTENDGYLLTRFGGGDCMGFYAGGRIQETGGNPPNGGTLTLEYDNNGVRESKPIPINPDGSFSAKAVGCKGANGGAGRPLLLYKRANGDNVNIGYVGNGVELRKDNRPRGFEYDSLRNKVREYLKNNPSFFPFRRPNGVTLGVRG